MSKAIASQKKISMRMIDAQTLLVNFRNVTMNAVVNSRSDNVDIFSDTMPQNPLMGSKAIETWFLTMANKERDLRSLLKQQVQQSPSIDQAVWRSKCLLQVMEQQKPKHKIAKTGMQSLLRFWMQHPDNVTLTGEKYQNQKGEFDSASYEHVAKGSFTIEHAIARVKDKLPRLSIFRPPPKDETLNSDTQQTLFHP
ncbi:hypothetical protein [Legionella sp. W05-934-2]|uniref:hypothetical protein n=1 Tax=Legionella sp. W05-934-2 TaxID=1198649 RepID=UPI003462AAF1